MPDPLTALSLASSIAQLVEFVKDVISDGRQIARLGSTSENEHIRTVVEDIGNLSTKVVEYSVSPICSISSDIWCRSAKPYELAGNRNHAEGNVDTGHDEISHETAHKEQVTDEEALRQLAQASCEVSTELSQLLEKLHIRDSPDTRKGRRGVLNLSFKTMLKKDEIHRLQNRLEKLQLQLHRRLSIMMLHSNHQREVRRNIFDTLLFPQINDREDGISSSYAKTFNWVFKDDTIGFTTWARIKSGLFWVTGKPGSGKSTLMKYLSNHRSTRTLLQSWAGSDKLIIASHYFWIVGTATQKSQSGLLRSLLFQILQQCPELAPIIVPQRFLERDNVRGPWTMSELTETMRKIVELADLPVRVCIFIDGLDEYDGEHTELIQLLFDLEKSPRIKMTVSSRPWNVFANAYERLPRSNTIVMQDLTREDILTYVQGKLAADERFQKLQYGSSDNAGLIKDITDRSQGVFLWVFLVVRSLLRGLTNGDDLELLRQRVAAYPDSLDGYFSRMLNSTEKVYSVQNGRILLAAIHSEGSLPLRIVDDLYTGTKDPDYDLWLSVAHTEPSPPQEAEEITRVRKLLDARCRDLLEVVGRRIDFLHRTVKDFLATGNLYAMLRDRAGSGFDPVISLSKVTLAVIKTNRNADLFNLLHYERITGLKTWPSDLQFLEHLAAMVELKATPRVDPDKNTLHFMDGTLLNDAMETEIYKMDGELLVYTKRSSDALHFFLNVNQSQDWLISVQEDLTTTIGSKGRSYLNFDHYSTRHSWIRFYSRDLLDSIILIQYHDTKAPFKCAIDDKTHVFVTRFREGGQGVYERQRAFIRIAQAFFSPDEYCRDALRNIFPSPRSGRPETQVHVRGIPHWKYGIREHGMRRREPGLFDPPEHDLTSEENSDTESVPDQNI